jgi:hypothetical protein
MSDRDARSQGLARRPLSFFAVDLQDLTLTEAQVQAQSMEIKMLSQQMEDMPGGTEATQPLTLLFSSVSVTFLFEIGIFDHIWHIWHIWRIP